MISSPHQFGRVLAQLLINSGYVRGNFNPDWVRFVASLPGVSYETLRKAVSGERTASEQLMRSVAEALKPALAGPGVANHTAAVSRRTFAVMIIIIAALVQSADASSGEQQTAVHHYVPFKSGRLAPGLTVSASVRGHCWSESALMDRRYAWRCLVGNLIYDPCFSATTRGHMVVCPDLAWSKRVQVIRLTRALPPWKLYKSRRYVPWGIWTTTGKRCFKLSHWQSEVARKRVTHYCVGGGVLAGFADRRRPTWKIYYAPSPRSKRATLVGITDAWQ